MSAAASAMRSLSETLDLRDQASEVAEPLVTLVTEYLSAQHDPVSGCTMAALASELSRANGPVRHTFTAQVSALFERIARKFFPARRTTDAPKQL